MATIKVFNSVKKKRNIIILKVLFQDLIVVRMIHKYVYYTFLV